MKTKWVSKIEIETTIDEKDEVAVLPFDKVEKIFDAWPETIANIIAGKFDRREHATVKVSVIEKYLCKDEPKEGAE